MSLQIVQQNSVFKINCPLSQLEIPDPDLFKLIQPQNFVGVELKDKVTNFVHLQERLQNAIDHKTRDQMIALLLGAFTVGLVVGMILNPTIVAVFLGIGLCALGIASDSISEAWAEKDKRPSFGNLRHIGALLGIPKLIYFMLTRKNNLESRNTAFERVLGEELKYVADYLQKNQTGILQQLDQDEHEAKELLETLNPKKAQHLAVEVAAKDLSYKIAHTQRLRVDLTNKVPKFLGQLYSSPRT